MLPLNLAVLAAIAQPASLPAPVSAPSPVPPATSARAQASLATYLSDDDYPAQAVLMHEQGTVGFRLGVSAEGTVTNCSVIASSGSAILDSTTCRLMSERARFTPARDASGAAVPDSFQGRIRWALPETPADREPLDIGHLLRSVANVWEVTADGRERSCRREYVHEGGERLDLPTCAKLNARFVPAAAAYLGARPEEILTVRLEYNWTLDPVLPFPAVPEDRGELLVRAEGDYQLNDDLTVRECVAGRFSARFSWLPIPCFRKTFTGHIPSGTKRVRMEVQWVVSRGPDTDRPTQLPQFTPANGKPGPVIFRSRDTKEGASPRQAEPAPSRPNR